MLARTENSNPALHRARLAIEHLGVVATMPAAEATQLAKATAQTTGIAVTELQMSGLLLGAKIGRREHIAMESGKPRATGAGCVAIANLTVWIDNQLLYVVRGNGSPSPTARYLGAPPEDFFAHGVLKYQYGSSADDWGTFRKPRIL
jgi:hypothetical protein